MLEVAQPTSVLRSVQSTHSLESFPCVVRSPPSALRRCVQELPTDQLVDSVGDLHTAVLFQRMLARRVDPPNPSEGSVLKHLENFEFEFESRWQHWWRCLLPVLLLLQRALARPAWGSSNVLR